MFLIVILIFELFLTGRLNKLNINVVDKTVTIKSISFIISIIKYSANEGL